MSNISDGSNAEDYYNSLNVKLSKLKDKLVNDRVNVDQEYILQSTRIAAKRALVNSMIAEIIDLEREHKSYTFRLRGDLVYADPEYQKLRAKLAKISEKLPSIRYKHLQVSQHNPNITSAVNKNNNPWTTSIENYGK